MDLALQFFQSPSVIKEENTLLDQVIEVIKNGGSEEELMEASQKMTEDMFMRAEVKLIKCALSTCQTKVRLSMNGETSRIFLREQL